MSPSMAGALMGFLIGMMGFVIVRLAASRVERMGVTQQPQQTARILRMVAWADLVFFTAAGWIVGPALLQQHAG